MKNTAKIFKMIVNASVILIYVAMIIVLMVQALIPGEESANISDSFGDKINQAVTDIRQPVVEKINVTGVEIDSINVGGEEHSEETITMPVGTYGSIFASVYPADATNRALVYSSDNESVLYVYSDGRISARSQGDAIITVSSAENLAISSSVSVSVMTVPLEHIEIHNLPDSIRVGDSLRLEIEYYPSNAGEREVVWHSSDSSIVSIDERGTVTAHREGKAIVYATSEDNENITSLAEITVLSRSDTEIISPTSIVLSADRSTLGIGETEELSVKLYPEGSSGSMIWYSSDESVVNVDQRGIITCHSAGIAIITLRCGELEERIQITVTEVLSENIYLSFDGIEIADDTYRVKQGSSAKVLASLDENATILDVTFTSSNEWVARIGADGVIEARHGGKTTVTVSTAYGDEMTTVSFVLTVDPITLEDTIDNFYTWVRKAMGHFGAFLVLGIFASMTYCIIFNKSLRGRLLAFLVCTVAGFAVAGITEILQLPIFTVGRGPSFSDVMLDFTGYCTSVVPIYAIVLLVYLISDIVKVLKEKKHKRA